MLGVMASIPRLPSFVLPLLRPLSTSSAPLALRVSSFVPACSAHVFQSPRPRQLCNTTSQSPVATLAETTRPNSPPPYIPPDQESLLSYVKEKASRKAVRRLYSVIEECEKRIAESPDTEHVQPDATIYRTAIRGLINSGRIDLAVPLLELRQQSAIQRPERLRPDIFLVMAVVKGIERLCKKRNERTDYGLRVFHGIVNEVTAFMEMLKSSESNFDRDQARIVSGLLSTTVLLLDNGKPERANKVFSLAVELAELKNHAPLPIEDYNTAIRLLGKHRQLSAVFSVLDLMRAASVSLNNETFEFLANAAVRQARFVTGAVSMQTLPEELRAEVAFVGRSNVGKSSLVNMICNRKALAYVSGRPGKTQQFNYFVLNENDAESKFYIVDMPGVGYAKVPIPVKQKWLAFMREYFQYRESLRLIFHLIDGRHGALQDDEELMAEMAATRRTGNYVIVLTKMDKMDKQKVKKSILDRTISALVRNGCPADTPVVVTSANTRLGRDEMWRHLQAVLTDTG